MTTGSGDRTPIEELVEIVKGWPEVTLGPHSYDGVEFHIGEYEFGHVHFGWQSLHVNYPRRMRDALIGEGRTDRHQYFSNSGWTNRQIERLEDVEDGRWLLRLSYLYRALTRRRHSAEATAVLKAVNVGAELDDLGVSETVRDLFEEVVDPGSVETAAP